VGAGTIYLPVRNLEIDGMTGVPHLVITNTDFQSGAAFSTYWIPDRRDGVVRPENAESPPIVVGPGQTFLLNAAQGTGMLEVDLDEALVADARLVISSVDAEDGELPIAIDVPVTSSSNVRPAGDTLFLQGLERTRFGSITDVVILNLGHDATQCIARIIRANGGQVGGDVFLGLPALSHTLFDDAFSVLGTEFIAEAKLELSCDEPFWAFATVRTPKGPVARYVRPAQPGTSSLRRPGDGFVDFQLPGLFFRPVNGDSVREYDLPLEPGLPYRYVEIEFDLLVRDYHTQLFHSLVGMRRVNQFLYFGMFMRASNGRTIIDLGDGTEVKDDSIWQQRSRYHVYVRYDAEAGVISVEMYQAGRLVDSFSGPLAHRDLRDNGTPVNLVFGLRKVADGAFFPPYDWEFSNLSVVAVP
jgi:hypothetical protein